MTRETALAIGPANYAGQAYQWAEAVHREFAIPVISFGFRDGPWRRPGSGPFQFPVHRLLPHHRLSTPIGKAWRVHRILRGVTHLAVDGFLPLYSRLDRSDVGREFDRLRRRGLRIVLIAHGSELRDPDAHAARHDFSYYRDAPTAWVERLRAQSRRNRQLAESLGVPVFVSTPDLMLDAPRATWLPLCVQATEWSATGPALHRKVPRVLHLPSRRNPPIKGTGVVDPILRDLAARGRIEYLAPECSTHAAVPDLVRRADIVVDQILTGSYGVAAVEAMAAARLVVGFVGAQTRELMPEEPPIVDAPPPDFSAVMDDILARPADYAVRAAAGPRYVTRWHDGTASAAALKPFLG
jgi:hypothetical protein